MFDISWSELLILGVVTLIFVGPKELPRFLGTLGRYAGMVRRQANEFRRVFDEAMREAELQDIKKSVDEMRDGMTSTFRDIKTSATSAMNTDVPKAPVPPQATETKIEPAPAATETTIADAPKPEAAAEGAPPSEPAPQQISFPLSTPIEAPKPEPVPAESKAAGGNS